jgi:hypothetical protein
MSTARRTVGIIFIAILCATATCSTDLLPRDPRAVATRIGSADGSYGCSSLNMLGRLREIRVHATAMSDVQPQDRSLRAFCNS